MILSEKKLSISLNVAFIKNECKRNNIKMNKGEKTFSKRKRSLY